MAESDQSNNQPTILAEEVGNLLGSASATAMFAIGAAYIINVVFLLDQVIIFNRIEYNIIFSVVMTVVLPSIVIRTGWPKMKADARRLQNPNFRNRRGEKDAAIVAISSFFSIFLLMIYIFAPTVQQVTPTSPIIAFSSSDYSFIDAVNILYMDLLTVFSLVGSLGFGIVALFRTIYPRACNACGNRKCLNSDYCSGCGTELEYIPGYIELLKSFAWDKNGIRTPTEDLEDRVKEDKEEKEATKTL